MPRLSAVLLIIFVTAALLISSAALARADMMVVPASEILQQISSGRHVDYDGVTVTGDLNISQLPHPEVKGHFFMINSIIPNSSFDGVSFGDEVSFWGTYIGNSSFDNARFSALTDFSNVSFDSSSFEGATFEGPVIFDGSTFWSNISFEDSQFNEDARFNDARFRGDSSFNYSHFGSYTYFTSSRFQRRSSFSNVVFGGPADFTTASFSGPAFFFMSRFENTAGFDSATFGGLAQFGMTKFGSLSSFGDAEFGSDASFILCQFSESANFVGAWFKGTALFGLAKFGDIASFQNAAFDGDLNFKSSRISTLLLNDARFAKGSQIWLNDSDISRLKGRWSLIGSHLAYDAGAFTSLIDNYRGLGWSQDEDDCYYQYRLMSQSQKEFGWSKVIDVLAWLSCGYGVRPSYAFVWSLITIVAFGLIFWIGDGIRRSAKPLHGPAEIDPVPERATLRSSLFFSTMIFLSQGPIDFLPTGKYRYLVIIEGILGWLLLALFLVTLGKVMIR